MCSGLLEQDKLQHRIQKFLLVGVSGVPRGVRGRLPRGAEVGRGRHRDVESYPGPHPPGRQQTGLPSRGAGHRRYATGGGGEAFNPFCLCTRCTCRQSRETMVILSFRGGVCRFCPPKSTPELKVNYVAVKQYNRTSLCFSMSHQC